MRLQSIKLHGRLIRDRRTRVHFRENRSSHRSRVARSQRTGRQVLGHDASSFGERREYQGQGEQVRRHRFTYGSLIELRSCTREGNPPEGFPDFARQLSVKL